jgi:hypothetical protein
MDHALDAILKSLPPPRRRSKLEPYAALIRALRDRGRSYREIVAILRERCGLSVGVHAVYRFVQRRAQRHTARRRAVHSASPPVRPAVTRLARAASRSVDAEHARTRIAAVKQRAPASASPPKAFAYDETEPLQLVDAAKPRKA